MEKFSNLLPKGLLLSYLVKMLLVTASFADVGITLALTSLVALQYYIEKHRSIQEQNAVIAKQNQVLEQFAVEFTKVKNDMAGVKLRSDFQQAAPGNTPKQRAF